jgi:hypothetical protein
MQEITDITKYNIPNSVYIYKNVNKSLCFPYDQGIDTKIIYKYILIYIYHHFNPLSAYMFRHQTYFIMTFSSNADGRGDMEG